ncbi:MAG: acetate/propionate family kinase [Alphaproteobacteria bacterium]|nr:acetate/propionate family kinase [Alphaproteobacteria bacterium]MDE2336375.1 acetate/propionate family kinase [Alphaproteobacteria bacterium]
MTGSVLVINAGSSSVKFSLFADNAELKLLAGGQVAGIGTAPVFVADDEKKPLAPGSTHEEALRFILGWIEEKKHPPIGVAAHRVVHGGTLFRAPVAVTPEIMEKLRGLKALAPLHQPHNLAAIDILTKLKPDMRQIACFDTAFHAEHDPLFGVYALPPELADKGIRRYGFHGLSYEWIAHVLRRDHPALAGGRVIVAHLGNGASLCAMKDGKSVDTTMGMTALDGLPMGTRSGALDPGAVIYMVRDLGLSPEKAEHILYNASGLKGLSGLSNDVKTLLESDDPKAAFALDYFSLRVAQFMGMMAVALGGVDGVVFTGGIGEHAAAVRENVLRRVAFLQPFETHVIPANEERIMAMHAVALQSGQERKNA